MLTAVPSGLHKLLSQLGLRKLLLQPASVLRKLLVPGQALLGPSRMFRRELHRPVRRRTLGETPKLLEPVLHTQVQPEQLVVRRTQEVPPTQSR